MARSRCLGMLVLAGLAVANPARGDEAALRDLVRRYADAFNARDVAALSAAWAEDAVHADRVTGERTEGREAIVADIEAAFDRQPAVRLSVRVDQVQMLTPSAAKIDGETSLATGDDVPSPSAFTAIVVEREGKWSIASIDEMAVAVAESPRDALAGLDWLVGRWVDEGGDARVETTVRWSPNDAFLIRSFGMAEDSGAVQQGTQIIGWDPVIRQIRSWSFHSDGSFGEGTWSQNGEDWLIKSQQVLADGRQASGTFVLTRQGNDRVEMRLIGHEVEGEPQPSTGAVVAVRSAEAANELTGASGN